LIGNGVATVVISRWEKEITAESLNENLQKVHTPGTIESNLTGISATPEQISAP
jgi:hypothetical protein